MEDRKGLPYISLIESLVRKMQVPVAELLSGEQIVNGNKVANVLRGQFYTCPVCGNVIYALGKGTYNMFVQEEDLRCQSITLRRWKA